MPAPRSDLDPWHTTAVGELCDAGLAMIQTGPFGSQLHSSDYEITGVPVIPTEAIRRRRLSADARYPRIAQETAQRLSRHTVHPGDILFARRGAQATGLSALVEQHQAGWICGTGALLLRVLDPQAVSPAFISFLLSAEDSIEWLKAHAAGAVMPNLNSDIVRRFPLNLPSIDEQRAIAETLGALDDKIDVNRQMNRTLQSVGQSLFKSWFVDFDPLAAKSIGRNRSGVFATVASHFSASFGESTLGPIPKGWRVGSVKDEFRVVMGQSPPSATYNLDSAGLAFFQGRADFGFRFPEARVYCTAGSRFADRDDSLVSVRAPVGDVNIAWNHCVIGRGLAAVRHRTGSASYTYYSMQALADEFNLFQGHGTLFGSIGRLEFEGINVVAPPDPLVLMFQERAGPLDDRIRANEEEILTLTALGDYLLPKLLSGEVRVREAEKLVERVGA
jgi:type I restriction enzyme S subunit